MSPSFIEQRPVLRAAARQPSVANLGHVFAGVFLSLALGGGAVPAIAQDRATPARPAAQAAVFPDELAALSAERRVVASLTAPELLALSGALSVRADRVKWLLGEIDEVCPAEALSDLAQYRDRTAWLAALADASGGGALDAAGGAEVRTAAEGRSTALRSANARRPALQFGAWTIGGQAVTSEPLRLPAGAEPVAVRFTPAWSGADPAIPAQTAQLAFTLQATTPGNTPAISTTAQRDAAGLELIELSLAIPEQAGEYTIALAVTAAPGPSAEAWWPLEVQLPTAMSATVIRPMAAPPPPPPNALAAQVARDVGAPRAPRGAQLATLIGRRARAARDGNTAVAEWLDWYLGLRADAPAVPELASVQEPWVAVAASAPLEPTANPLDLLSAVQARKARATGITGAAAPVVDMLPGNLPNENLATTVAAAGGGQIVSATYDAVIELVQEGDRLFGVILSRAQRGNGYELLAFDGRDALLARLRERGARTAVVCVDAGIGVELLTAIEQQVGRVQLAASLAALGTSPGQAWKADGQLAARLAIFRASPAECEGIEARSVRFAGKSFDLLVE
ncbi:MAG: hypothetical protein HRU75_13705 [Planctomycetia bacterium]|nr:MAG: hypothetical protein HRU75_13705 [Planctomycetia bacterium]